jgi:hypothetical protein
VDGWACHPYIGGVNPSLRTAIALLCFGLVAALPAAAQAQTPKLYLALGDSLAVGVQPTAGGENRNTRQGYPNQLAAAERLLRRNR